MALLSRKSDPPPHEHRPDGLIRASSATERQADDYSKGFCHVLAVVLSEHYGWRMRAMSYARDEYSIGPSLPTHVYCLDDSGRPVDVFGVWESEEALAAFFADECELRPMEFADVSREQVEADLVPRGYPALSDYNIEMTVKSAKRIGFGGLVATA